MRRSQFLASIIGLLTAGCIGFSTNPPPVEKPTSGYNGNINGIEYENGLIVNLDGIEFDRFGLAPIKNKKGCYLSKGKFVIY